MTHQTKHGWLIQLECVGAIGHTFFLQVDYKQDLTEAVTGFDKRGSFVLYRDRSFVECPNCKAYCHLTGVRVEVDVKFTPEQTQ